MYHCIIFCYSTFMGVTVYCAYIIRSPEIKQYRSLAMCYCLVGEINNVATNGKQALKFRMACFPFCKDIGEKALFFPFKLRFPFLSAGLWPTAHC